MNQLYLELQQDLRVALSVQRFRIHICFESGQGVRQHLWIELELVWRTKSFGKYLMNEWGDMGGQHGSLPSCNLQRCPGVFLEPNTSWETTATHFALRFCGPGLGRKRSRLKHLSWKRICHTDHVDNHVRQTYCDRWAAGVFDYFNKPISFIL